MGKTYGRVFLLILATLLGTPPTAQAQKLDSIRNSVRKNESRPQEDPDAGSGESKRRKRRDERPEEAQGWFDDDDDDDDFGFGNLIGGALLFAASSPYWGPTAAVGDDFVTNGYFESYPNCDDAGCITYQRRGRSFLDSSLIRFRVEAGTDFDDVSLAGGQLLFDTPIRFGVDTEANYRHEQLLAFDDDLWTGDLNLVYRFAQSPRFQMRSGLGINWISDSDDTDIGFNFTYGGDLMLLEPWILSIETDLGSIGSETLFHGRATLGVNYRNAEIYTGFDHFQVGSDHISSVVTGLRFWF